jgi:uncharacterized membrane-anchored protein
MAAAQQCHVKVDRVTRPELEPAGAGETAVSISTASRVPRAVKVPAITALFWVVKALTTAFGESTSDFSVHAIAPVAAVLIGFIAFCAAMAIQLRSPRYQPWKYWLAVSMVGVFGTMAADVLHVGFGVPYAVSTPLFAIALAAVFVAWYRTEGTLSIHSVDTRRREIFYWLAVVATFALGTAAGDLAAYTLNLGYLVAAAVFAGLIAVPATGYRFLGWNAVASFWAAYVLTRPLGASIADWLGKPRADGGLGVGAGTVALLLGAAIVVGVAFIYRAETAKRAARATRVLRHSA